MLKRIKKICAAGLTAVMLAGAACPAYGYSAADISGHWAQSTINKWTTRGYINGYPDGTFRPDSPISRAEFVALANKSFYVNDRGDISFGDVTRSHWAYDEISKGIGNGYIQGNGDGTFSPDNRISRQEAAAMITKIKKLSLDQSYSRRYSDYYDIASWAREYVGGVTKAEIMRGYPDGSFKPMGNMTRAEAVVALDMALDYSIINDGNSNNNNSDNSSKDDTSVNGDYTMSAGASALSDRVIEGDLIIPKDISSKTIRLDNVTVKGDVIVRGGSRINAVKSTFDIVKLDKKDVVFNSDKDTKINEAVFLKDAEIQGYGYQLATIDDKGVDKAAINARVKRVYLNTDADIDLLANADIDELETSKNTGTVTVDFTRGASVDDMTIRDTIKITGNGTIDTMNAYASGIRSSIVPDTLKTRNGASTPTYTSSSSGSSSSYRNLTIGDKNDRFDGNGKSYNNVTIEADGARLTDVVVRGNLIISEKVGNGSVTLNGVEVRGKTYVYGGGENSVIFRDCRLNGDIVSDISNRKGVASGSRRPVAIKFDSKTSVKGTLNIAGNTTLAMESGASMITLPEVVLDSELSGGLNAGVNITELNVNRTNDIRLKNGMSVKTLNIQSRAGGSNIIFDSGNSRIDVMDAKAKATVSGSGKIGTIYKGDEVYLGTDVKYDNIISPSDIRVTGVSLSQTTVSLDEGASVKLTATVAPANATNKGISWSSSNPGAATVDMDGNVKAISVGTADITVKTTDGDRTAVCKVTVNKKDNTVKVTGVSLSQTTVSLDEGASVKLTATVAPANATNKNISWSSSNPGEATVDTDGNVKAISVGTADITVKTADGDRTAVCKVTVNKKDNTVKVTGVSLSQTAVSLDEGESVKLTATVAPANATNKGISWSSSNPGAATVDTDGNVKAISVGTADITVKTADGGHTAVCKVTVNKKDDTVKVTGVSLSQTTVSLDEGASVKLTATVAPVNATNKGISWSSSNPGAATVDDNGNVSAEGVGTADITVKTADGGHTSVCKVTVNKKDDTVKVTGVSLSQTAVSLDEGESVKLTATVAPANATNKGISWSSSNPGAATVDTDGNVKAISVGTADITVKTADGGHTAVCKVTVNKKDDTVKVTGVSLSQTTVSLDEGASVKLTATVAPVNATNKAISWSSSNLSAAIVDADGNVEAISVGTADITVKTADGDRTAVCKVTVSKEDEPVEATELSISQTTASIRKGGYIKLSAKITPESETNKKVIWSSNNEKIATVDGNGEVKGIDVGSVNITAKIENTQISKVCTVNVSDVNNITLDKGEATVNENGIIKLNAVTQGGGIIWASSDNNIATVSQDGAVSGIKEGVAYITAALKDGSLDTCKVTVKKQEPPSV